MIRSLSILACLVWSVAASAETVIANDQVVRVTTAALPEAPEALARRLGKMLPEENVPVPAGAGTYALSYVGANPPKQFVAFLKDKFPDIRDAAFRPNLPANVSIVISEAGEGSSVQLVLLMPKSSSIQAETEQFHQNLFGQEFPASAKIYVSKSASNGSPSNIVLSLKQRRDHAAIRYAGWLEDEGFEVERSDKDDNIVLLAQRDQTVAFLFFQDDPDRKGGTMMVLQHMEE